MNVYEQMAVAGISAENYLSTIAALEELIFDENLLAEVFGEDEALNMIAFVFSRLEFDEEIETVLPRCASAVVTFMSVLCEEILRQAKSIVNPESIGAWQKIVAKEIIALDTPAMEFFPKKDFSRLLTGEPIERGFASILLTSYLAARGAVEIPQVQATGYNPMVAAIAILKEIQKYK